MLSSISRACILLAGHACSLYVYTMISEEKSQKIETTNFRFSFAKVSGPVEPKPDFFGEKKVPPSLVKISIRGSEVNAEVVKQVLTGFLGLSNRSKKLTEE